MPIPLNQREPLLLSNQNLDRKDYKVFNKLMSYKVSLIFKTFNIKVIDIGSDTFGNQFIQKILQNQPSSPILSIPKCFADLCGLAKKC
jgi:hypothetical protein